MKMKITDLLDSYRDRDDLLGADTASGSDSTVAIHETRRRSNWMTFAGIAAALAVMVGAAFLLIPKLKQSAGPMSEGDVTQSTTTEPQTDPQTDEEKYGLNPGFYVVDSADYTNRPCMNLHVDQNGTQQFRMSPSMAVSVGVSGTWKVENGRLICTDERNMNRYAFALQEDGSLVWLEAESERQESMIRLQDGDRFVPESRKMWTMEELCGTYLMRASESELQKPYLNLTLDNTYKVTFMMGPSMFSSYAVFGNWKLEDDILILESDEDARYAFAVSDDGTLAYLPGQSARTELQLPDGAIFERMQDSETAAIYGNYVVALQTVDSVPRELPYLSLFPNMIEGSSWAVGMLSDGVPVNGMLVGGTCSFEDGLLTCVDEAGSKYVFKLTEAGELVCQSCEKKSAASPAFWEAGLVFVSAPEPAQKDPADAHSEDPGEDIPPEYPVQTAIPANGADNYDNVFFPRTGKLNCYLYRDLPAAAQYVERLRDYTAEAFGCKADDLTRDEWTAYDDGYANNSLTGPNDVHASISGNFRTGRFSYHRIPTAEEIQNELSASSLDQSVLESAARAFVDRFSDVTGPLTLAEMKFDTQSYLASQTGEEDTSVLTVTFCYVAGGGHGALEAQPGLTVPIQCTNGASSDPDSACFSVTVGMNGKVLFADNCVTRAETELDSLKKDVPTEDNIPGILSYFTSTVKDDTMILHKVEVTHYTVYFGGNDLVPLITLTYSFASDPDNILTTQIALDAPLEP